MKLKSICVTLILAAALASGCNSPSSYQTFNHRPPTKTWEATDDLTISSKDFDLAVLQIIVMPKHITLISAAFGDQGKNVSKVDISDDQDQPRGQAKVTTIRAFSEGKLVAFTFSGNRQQMSTPHFLIGEHHLSPLHLPQDGEDRGGTFMSGVISANIGDVTLFSSGNGSSKGEDFFGGPDNIASFAMKINENNQDSWIYLLVTADGNVSEISEEQYMNIPLKYKPTSASASTATPGEPVTEMPSLSPTAAPTELLTETPLPSTASPQPTETPTEIPPPTP